MKGFISVDLEGMPFIVIPGHLDLKGSLYEEARRIATKITLIVADELHKNGFEQVVIADSHGPMVNLLVDELPEYIELVRGNPRPISMIAGIEGCDVAIFLGYHAKFGTAKSTFDHTYSSNSIHKIEVNDKEMSEFLLNAAVAGELSIPSILVAGEKELLEQDVKQTTPWVEAVPLKHSLGRMAAKSFSLKRIEKDLREATKKAVSNYKEKKVKPYIIDKKLKVTITFRSTLFADVAELLPFITRIDGLKVEFKATNMSEAYKAFQALCLLAYGATASVNDLK